MIRLKVTVPEALVKVENTRFPRIFMGPKKNWARNHEYPEGLLHSMSRYTF